MPVYLFTGFLEAGKTRFIQETLEDKRFCKGEKTLLLVCEEGVEEYEPDQFCTKTVAIRTIADQSELTSENLLRLARETDAERVVVEYNGMWMLDLLYTALPEGWMVYQEFFFADARTFLVYNENMRQLVYDKLKSCELAVFNRFTPDMDKMAFHRIVRGASRRCDIAYEAPDGKVEYDDIVDPLPFDVDAPVIEIGDDDYALWYRDLSEEPKKYEGKTVCFRCQAVVRGKLPSETFVVGRPVMTCCVQDIQFAGLVCQWKNANTIQDDSWIVLTARINFKFNRAYGKKGPVLTFLSMEPSEEPEQPVASFY
jgi:hypothetical protein